MSLLSLPISIGVNALFSALVNWGADGAQLALRDVIGGAIVGTTTVDLGQASWLSSVTRNMFPVEELVMVPLLFAATIGAILRQDMRRLARAWGIYLPVSIAGRLRRSSADEDGPGHNGRHFRRHSVRGHAGPGACAT